MIIICACCEKKFLVDDSLIPKKGRKIQCGACDHVWFYKKPKNDIEVDNKIKEENISIDEEIQSEKKVEKTNENLIVDIDNIINTKDTALVKYQKVNHFSFNKFLSYCLVAIISLIGVVIVLDTFKFQLYSLIPNLEFLLFSLFETLKDIGLFIKDLI
tara:strand:+ start:34 stop:507 length:474 start_codon:yes stop_codon:yes gene_type:complete